MRNGNINLIFAERGGVYVTDIDAHAGPYIAIFAHEDCVIASMTCAKITGTLTSIAIPKGVCYPLPGGATALTLASGKATLINA
jgi:hypothetical protein